MATQRYISTSFWTDKWIRSLDPSERYLYMYLLTNPQTNIAGVYDITIDRIAFDTGYDERTLQPMFERFSIAGKAHYLYDEWIIIPSWPRHQRVGERDNNRKGIDNILKELPDEIFDKLEALDYQYLYLGSIVRPLQAPSKPLARKSNYSDTDTDTDTDTEQQHQVSDFLFLTETEIEKLTEKYPGIDLDEIYEEIDNWVLNKKKTKKGILDWKDHYRGVMNWIKKKIEWSKDESCDDDIKYCPKCKNTLMDGECLNCGAV